jgi:hypothetical protein
MFQAGIGEALAPSEIQQRQTYQQHAVGASSGDGLCF